MGDLGSSLAVDSLIDDRHLFWAMRRLNRAAHSLIPPFRFEFIQWFRGRLVCRESLSTFAGSAVTANDGGK
jgi:hypothetical protein